MKVNGKMCAGRAHDFKTAGEARLSKGPLHSYSYLGFILWTLVVIASFWFTSSGVGKYAEEAAIIQARTAFEKDVAYRRWSSNLGGVYVPVTGLTPPNPHLTGPNRDFAAPFDDSLIMTKINPAYMVRLVYEQEENRTGVKGHMTSRQPIRPENAPDPWAASALAQLEGSGAEEVAALMELDGQNYLRFMRPLIVEKSCLACHANYNEGDIRGGIGIAVPMSPFLQSARLAAGKLILAHLAVWVVGTAFIVLAGLRLARQIRKRVAAEADLRQMTSLLEVKVAERTEALRMRQQVFQAFLDHTDAGVYLKNSDGEFILVNKNFLEHIHKREDEVLGKKNEEVFADEALAVLNAVEGKVLKTRSSQWADGLPIPLNPRNSYEVLAFPIFYGETADEPDGVGSIIVDVTRHKMMETALRAAKDSADAANQAKSEFLANMSHEIRTPLNGILGMADILQHSQMLPENIAKIEVIKKSGDSLLTLINSILDFSKIEAGKMVLEKHPFNFPRLVFDIGQALAPIAERKHLALNVRVNPRIPAEMIGDSTRLRQIITNLAGNAIKFTEQGEVTIDVELLTIMGSRVNLLISIADTGIGISQDKQSVVFKAFEQSDNSCTRKFGGTGLGLTISRSLIRLMGSDLLLDSEPGVGSTFHFNLKLDCEPGSRPDGEGYFSEVKHDVLVVGSNMACLEYLEELMWFWGLNVHMASDRSRALTLMRNRRRIIDLLYVAVEDHDPNILDFMGAVHQHHQELPVILLAPGNYPYEPEHWHVRKRLIKPAAPGDILKATCEVLGFSSAVQSENQEEPAGRRENIKPLKFLVAEDVDLNQMVVTSMLGKLGHKSTVVGNGAEAVAALEKETFDAVLMDIQMPVMDGVTATKIIRERDRHIPIVALTANAIKGDREQYLSSGMNYYLSKPISFSALKGLLEQLSAQKPRTN